MKRNARLLQASLWALAGVFVVVGVVTLHFAMPGRPIQPLFILVAGWCFAWGGSLVILHRKIPDADLFIMPVVALLTGWGLLMQARLAPPFLLRQVLWLLLGCGVMCLVALIPTLTRILRRYRYSLLTLGLLLLGMTLVFGVNPSGYGQRLWLGALGVYFQPSEPLKLLLVIYLAAYLAESPVPRRQHLAYCYDVTAPSLHRPLWIVILGPMLTMVGLALLLLGWQQDLGAALLFYLTFVAMLYLAWGNIGYVLLSLLLFVPVAGVGYFASSRVALRVHIWLDPWVPERVDQAFQILQSLFALASGGLFGQGSGQGFPTLIPAVHTDFVYAALVEEFGLLGGLALIALVGLLVYRAIALAQQAESPFEALLAGGIAAIMGIQTWVIVGGNIKLVPITGVTLPYLSYGGSSLLTMLLATGLLLNLSTSHPIPLVLPLSKAHASLPQTAAYLGKALLVLLATTALATGIWTLTRAEALRVHAANPRRILTEARIRRGRILDRHGILLAGTALDDAGYVTRTYPVPEAAPVVGFATFEYGTAGIEATCDARLRGDVRRTAWDATLDALVHRDVVGADVRLTLDASLQRQAQHLLRGHRGAAVLADAHTGEILVLASTPMYDPAEVETDWDMLRDDPASPLLNRATQGLAQPGAILETVVLGIVLQNTEEPSLPSPVLPLTLPVAINGNQLKCAKQPRRADWEAALANTCPAPFVALDRYLNNAHLVEGLARWGLTDAPPLEISTVAVPWESPADGAAELLGQGELLVTPLHMVGVAATLGNDGQRPPLHILADARLGCEVPAKSTATRVVSPEDAMYLRGLWSDFETAIGHLGEALAGPQRIQSWFIGLNSAQVPRYAVAVLLENPETSQLTASIGTELLARAVAPR